MTIEEESQKKHQQVVEVMETVVKLLDGLEPSRRVRVLLAVTLISCPQALTTEQVVSAFNTARLG